MVQVDVIFLIAKSWRKNEKTGKMEATEYRKKVFAEIDAINQAEFYSAAQAGLKAAFKATVFGGDYSGEELVEWKGKRYAVYRQYSGRGKYKDSVRGDYIELYVREEAGI